MEGGLSIREEGGDFSQCNTVLLIFLRGTGTRYSTFHMSHLLLPALSATPYLPIPSHLKAFGSFLFLENVLLLETPMR